MELTSKQRAYLRSMAVDLDTILMVGKGGIGADVIKQADDAILKREILKGKVLETAPVSPREAAEELAQAVGAQVVQVIGTKFVLYRRNEKEPKNPASQTGPSLRHSMRYGIFGGTFNPVHEGHLHIARAFRKTMQLDTVLWIPTKVPPHKAAEDLALPEQRLEMCRLACRGEEVFQVSDLEIRREGKSYTADTLEELHEMYPKATFCLLMGEDMFLTLLNWYKPDTILRLAEICAVPRSVGHEVRLEEQAHVLREKGATVFLEQNPLSSLILYRDSGGCERR